MATAPQFNLNPANADRSAPLEVDPDELVDQALAKARQIMDDPLDDAITAAARSLRPCIAIEKKVRTSVTKQATRGQSAMAVGAKLAADGAQPGVTYDDTLGAKKSADLAYRKKVVKQILQQVGDAYGEQAEGAAEGAVDAMKAASLAIDKADTTWRLNLGGLDDSKTAAADEAREQRAIRRLKVAGIKGCAQALDSAEKHGDEAMLAVLLTAVPAVCTELMHDPAVLEAGKRRQVNDVSNLIGELSDDRVLARALIQRCERLRAERVPADLKLARTIFDELLMPAFSRVLGFNARTAPKRDFEAYVAKVTQNGGEADPFTLASDWTVRGVDVNALAMPPMQGKD